MDESCDMLILFISALCAYENVSYLKNIIPLGKQGASSDQGNKEARGKEHA